jgi:protoheme IX farnesyltransferase
MERNQVKTSVAGGFAQAISDFGLLVKFKLTLLVLFSAVMSYAIVCGGNVDWSAMFFLALGGFLVTGSANALNQVLECDYDLKMPRTANRPVATGRWSISKAVLWAGLMAVGGITILSSFNPLTGFLGTLSLISYAFVYTPLKRSTPLAVVVGAVPGALPLIIGCVAHEGGISTMAIMLFTLQFLWQFPHFWAVAWLADEDYKKAGFYLLPSRSGERDASIGLMSFGFCLLMEGNVMVSFWLGLVSLWAAAVLFILNGYWAWRCWQLYRSCSREAARSQMFVSFAHLPLSLLIILIDKL